MAEEEYGIVPYKDLSELKSQLEGIQGKKDVSTKDLHDAVVKLADAMGSMIDIFAAASEQLKLEEKEKEIDAKKSEIVAAKLDKLLDQNKTIAEGMVAVVEMVKERLGTKDDPGFRQKDEEQMFKKPEPRVARPEWKPRIEPKPMQPMAVSNPMAISQPSMDTPPMRNVPPPPGNDFGANLPPMQPAPMPDFDFPEDPDLEDLAEPKKKGLLGMFKK